MGSNIWIFAGRGAAAVSILLIGMVVRGSAQTPSPAQAPPTPAPSATTATPAAQTDSTTEARHPGGFVPGQQRPEGDPVKIAHGKALYDVNCRACHGADLRGGDMGGPNLLRSQVALSDKNGELIIPIIHGSRQSMGMPAIGIDNADAEAVAAYVRSVVGMIGRQGTPPSVGLEAPSILVGNVAEGKAYFNTKCSGCHSATGDLSGIATKISDPKTLQTAWVGAGRRSERRRPGAGPQMPDATVTVTPASGSSVEGKLVHIDDFLVTVQLADGTVRSFRRGGAQPKVEVNDPVKGHRDLLAEITDKDIHDVTAYLVTLK